MRLFTLLLLKLSFITAVSSQTFENAEYLRTFTAGEISGITLGLITAQFDVDVYKVTYHTPDQVGNDHIASGLVCIPLEENSQFPLACFQHGTVAGREDVPSNLQGGFELPLVLAGLGYVVTSPDYVGLGDSPGVHPYIHAATEASAGLDLLRATREMSADGGAAQPFGLNEQVFVTGYSQGGHAAMALHRSLELDHAAEFSVTAAAPMSGPYSVSGSMVDFTLGDEDYGTVSYLAWLFLGYQAVYESSVGQIPLEDMFKTEYIAPINEFKNENITLWDLNGQLVNILQANTGSVRPKDMLTENILNIILTDPTHPISVALADNDVYDWTPSAPTIMYYCEADDQVTFQNAILAEQVMQANGSTARAERMDSDFFPQDHGGCVIPASRAALDFFNGFRNILSSNNVVLFEEAKIYVSDNYLITDIPQQDFEPFQLQVYSQMGQNMLNYSVNEALSSEDVSTLPNGIYIVNLINNEGIVTTSKITKF